MEPQVKECWQPVEVKKHKEQIPSQSCQRKCGSANLMSTQLNSSQPCGLQNYERLNVCNFKSSSLICYISHRKIHSVKSLFIQRQKQVHGGYIPHIKLHSSWEIQGQKPSFLTANLGMFHSSYYHFLFMFNLDTSTGSHELFPLELLELIFLLHPLKWFHVD